MKRILALLLVAVMVLGLTAIPAKAEAETYPVIKFAYTKMFATPDEPYVEEEMNKILREKCGCEIDLVAIDFSNMQQHSGEHLVSGIVHRLYGFDNVGFHLSSNEVTMDYSGVIPEDGLLLIEEEANRAVWSNIPSVVRFTGPEERKDLSYRSKLDLEGTVRIVTYPGVDSCACCAPHVRRTGEIGLIKISGMINWKGGVRMSIVCGDRALRQMQELQRHTAPQLVRRKKRIS